MVTERVKSGRVVRGQAGAESAEAASPASISARWLSACRIATSAKRSTRPSPARNRGPPKIAGIRRLVAGEGGAVAQVVVTGGAGFLGSRLARELLAAGSLEVAGGGARPVRR